MLDVRHIENGFINVANGEVHLEISVATHAQRGSLSLNEALVYDSRIWQIVASGSSYGFQPTNVPNSQAGWRFVKGNETGGIQQVWQQELWECSADGGASIPQYNQIWFSWTDPTGAVHPFPGSTEEPISGACTGGVNPPPDSPTTTGYAADGSGYYIKVTNYTTATVYDSNGNEVYPVVTDHNGNYFSSDASGNLVDTLGRTPVLKTSSGNQTVYSVLTIGGARKQYTVTTETISVHTGFSQSGVNEYSGTLTAIASIGLPDGSSYKFNYDSGTSSGNYGELKSITLPTGGTVYLNYQNYLDSYQNQNRWLQSYSGASGSRTFAPKVVTQCTGSGKVGCQEQVTVTDGNENQVVYLLTLNNGAWNTQMDYYNGSSSHIMSTATNYNFATSCQTYNCSGSQWITTSSVTTTLSDTGKIAKTSYVYSNPAIAKPSKVQQWDYYTGSPSAVPTKETDITYGYSVNGAMLATQVNQLDSTGILAAQTIYKYDQTTPVATSGLPNHGTSAGGNITSVVSGVGTTVTTYSTYDDAGMKLSDVDGKSNTTQYSHSCSDAYLNNVTLPVVVNGSNLQSQTTFDCSSGLVTSTKDANGVANNLATSYTYFTSGTNIGKLETVMFPDGGSAGYAYPSAMETDQTVAQTASVTVTSKAILDLYGRPGQNVKVTPEGAISSATTYDGAGNPSCAITAHLESQTSPTDGSTCTSYDVLGRPASTSMPDGNATYSTYTGATQTVTDEVGHFKKYVYDAFHRLTSVLEPNSSGTLAYETDYLYNALDKLIQVDQWGGAKGATSPGDRQRLFAYDSLGREIAENIPENQSVLSPASLTCAGTSSGTKWTTCYSYDANGNATSTTDNAGNILKYTYDALNRALTQTQSPSGVSYTYKYDGTDGYSHTNPLGQLTYSTNNNSKAGSSLSYDSMGRLTNQNDCVPTNCIYGTSGINVSAAYDLAGNMVSLTYPDGRVLQETFDSANRFTGVNYAKWGATSVGTSYFSISKFAPPGQPTSSAMGSGVGIAASFNDRQSVTSLTYSNSSGTIWSKQFNWDKNGSNLLLLLDGLTGYGRQFTYDQLNRVASAQDIAVNNSGATKSTAKITIAGSDGYENVCTTTEVYQPIGSYWYPVTTCAYQYADGTITVSVGSFTTTLDYGGGSGPTTPATIAAALTSALNVSGSPVTASSSGAVITLASINGGADANYPLSASITTSVPSGYSATTLSVTPSGSTMTGGGGTPPAGALNETYSYDPFGNLTQSGNFTFSQSFNTLNQINGYSYDADGDQNSDIYNHALSFDPNGMLSSVAGTAETYVYDAQGNRVEVHGSTVTDVVYFGGQPVAMFSGGAYSDLIYAGGALIAEVGGTQNAVPVYRMTDSLGSLTSVNYEPYGQIFSGSTSDPYGFTGLQWDATSALYHATFRQFSPQQGRWQSPDPYSGSYNWADPQSLNRYAYVNGRPMAFTDPSGQSFCGSAAALGVLATGGPVGPATTGVICAFELLGGSWIADHMFGWLFGDSSFHGSLKPRPNASPWSERDPMTGITSLGAPMGGMSPLSGISGLNQALGLPSMGNGCEFGACGNIGDSFTTGVTTAPLTWCATHPQICAIPAEAEGFFSRVVPMLTVGSITMHMTGDKADPRYCQQVQQKAITTCAAKYVGKGHGSDAPLLVRKCVREIMESAGCSY